MKKHIYIFRINYLEVRKPIKISETISIIPGNYDLSQDKDLNFDISFQVNKYSYIFLERDNSLEFNDLKKELNLIFALISFLLSNWIDIYSQESYHIIYINNNKIRLEKGIIVPFKKYEFNRQYSRIYSSKNRIIKIIDKMYKVFMENCISDSIYFLIGQFLIAKRENILLTKAIYAWNVLEHLAFSYWENTNNKQLSIISEEKYKGLMDSLENNLEEFVENNIETDEIFISELESEFYNQNYINLLKNKLRNGVNNFSPIKYKIIRMFENEGLNITKQNYDLINKMNRLRNFIYHRGVKKEYIEKEIKRNPQELIQDFLRFLEIKLWQYFKFINEYAVLNGELISFKESQIPNKILEDGDYTEKIEILKKLELVKEKVESHSNKQVEVKIIREGHKFDSFINFNYKRDEPADSLVIDNLPQDLPSYGNIIKLKAKLDDLNVTFNFRGLFKFGTYSEIFIEKIEL